MSYVFGIIIIYYLIMIIIPFLWRALLELIKFFWNKEWQQVSKRDVYFSCGAVILCLLIHATVPPAKSYTVSAFPPFSQPDAFEKTEIKMNEGKIQSGHTIISHRKKVRLPVKLKKNGIEIIYKRFGYDGDSIFAWETLECTLTELATGEATRDYSCSYHIPIPVLRRQRFSECGQKPSETCGEDFNFGPLTFTYTSKSVEIDLPVIRRYPGGNVAIPNSFGFELQWWLYNDSKPTKLDGQSLPAHLDPEFVGRKDKSELYLAIKASDALKNIKAYGHTERIMELGLYNGCCDEDYRIAADKVSFGRILSKERRLIFGILPKLVSGQPFKSNKQETALMRKILTNTLRPLADASESFNCHTLVNSEEVRKITRDLNTAMFSDVAILLNKRNPLANPEADECTDLANRISILDQEMIRMGLWGISIK